jgi:hypothetical protein
MALDLIEASQSVPNAVVHAENLRHLEEAFSNVV